MHACKALPPTTSSRAFSLRYHRSGNFVVDRTRRHYRLCRANCHAENARRERVALLLANNEGSLAGCRHSLCPVRSRLSSFPSPPSFYIPSRVLALSLSFSLSISLSPSFSLSLPRSYSRDSLRLGLRTGEQPSFCRPIVRPGLLPLLPVYCANSSTYSFIPPVLSHSCSLSRKACLPARRFFPLPLIASVVTCRALIIVPLARHEGRNRERTKKYSDYRKNNEARETRARGGTGQKSLRPSYESMSFGAQFFFASL